MRHAPRFAIKSQRQTDLQSRPFPHDATAGDKGISNSQDLEEGQDICYEPSTEEHPEGIALQTTLQKWLCEWWEEDGETYDTSEPCPVLAYQEEVHRQCPKNPVCGVCAHMGKAQRRKKRDRRSQ
jgi:hypothetical protein